MDDLLEEEEEEENESHAVGISFVGSKFVFVRGVGK